MKKLLFGLSILFCLGCGVNSGTVISKHWQPSYVEIESYCAYTRRDGSCGQWVFYPVTQPAEYWLCLRDDTEDRPVNQRDTGCVQVDEYDFHRYTTDQHFP